MIRTADGIWLSQRQYALDMLSKYGMADCKPISMPLDVNVKLSAHAGDALKNVTMYRKIVGSLIYLMITRPDLSYTVGLESQFMQAPKKPHLDAVRRTLRYVRATLDHALFYAAGVPVELYGYTDADWAGSVTDRRSTSGFMFSLGSAAITWSSKKQPTVALSSTEAEYRGAAIATCEVAWLHKLLMDMGMHVDRGVVIYCDNLSSIQLARNPVFHARTKHIEVHYHFVRESRFWLETSTWSMSAQRSRLQTSSPRPWELRSSADFVPCLDSLRCRARGGVLRCRALHHELALMMGLGDRCGYLCHRHGW